MKRSSVEPLKTFRTPLAILSNSLRTPSVFALRSKPTRDLILGTSVRLAVLTSVCTLVACSAGSKWSSTTYQLPWADDSGNYSLQKVEVTTFSHPSDLEGQYGQVLVHPHDDDNKQLADTKAAGHFLKAGNVEIAADVLSLQAGTVYAHIERLHQLDTLTGAASAIHWPLTFGLDVNTTDGVMSNALYDPKRDAVVIMPYTAGRLPISINGGILAHEHFHTIFQALVMKQLPDLMLAPTPGLLEAAKDKVAVQGKSEWSPENFTISQAIAQRLKLIQTLTTENVNGSAPPPAAGATGTGSSNTGTASPNAGSMASPDAGSTAPTNGSSPSNSPPMFDQDHGFAEIPVPTFNSFLLHGINEGLADFYAWVYSGDPTFIEDSLPLEAVAFRKMNVRAQPMPTAELWQALLRSQDDPSKVAPASYQLGEAYVLGTYYSTFLRELALRLSNPTADVDESGGTPAPQEAAPGMLRASETEGSKTNFAETDASDAEVRNASHGPSRESSRAIVKDQKRANLQLPITSARNARAMGGRSASAIAARAAVANALVSSLPDLLKEVKANYKTSYLDPLLVVGPLFAHLGDVNASMCRLAQKFVSQMPIQGSNSALNLPASGRRQNQVRTVSALPGNCASLIGTEVVRAPAPAQPTGSQPPITAAVADRNSK